MKNFTLLDNDIELNTIIDTINDINKDTLYACHGRYHTKFVIATIEKILTGLGYDERTIELGKIAGLLHDIGVSKGKKGHAERSAFLCQEFLSKTTLTEEEKQVIIASIADHSDGSRLASPVGAALLIADKIDLSKNRVLELGKTDRWHQNLLSVEEVQLTVENYQIIVNYVVTPQFSAEILFSQWQKGTTVPLMASHYLGCGFIFQINGVEIKEKTSVL